MTQEYISEVTQLRLIVRGKYDEIADRAEVSRSTVQSVMLLKFKNKDVIREAKRIAKQLTKV
jgi:hypothetical protein